MSNIMCDDSELRERTPSDAICSQIPVVAFEKALEPLNGHVHDPIPGLFQAPKGILQGHLLISDPVMCQDTLKRLKLWLGTEVTQTAVRHRFAQSCWTIGP